MQQPFGTNQYCCGCLPIFYGSFAIAFHCLLQGIFGICLILTSSYRPKNEIINYTTLAGYICLAIVGIPILWAIFFEHIPSIKACAIFLFFMALFNLSSATAYFVEYYNFKANALLDKLFFRRHGHTWVNESVSPFTFWHLLTGLLISLTPIWFYYAVVLFLIAKYISQMEHPRLVEVVVLPNRMGPFGYPHVRGEPPQQETYQRHKKVQLIAMQRQPKNPLD